jgi:predicted transcriptional regulator
MDMYSEIRTLYSNGESIRSIAARLGIARQTVKKYCEGATHPEVRKEYHRKAEVVTDQVKQFILNCFQEDKYEKLIPLQKPQKYCKTAG